MLNNVKDFFNLYDITYNILMGNAKILAEAKEKTAHYNHRPTNCKNCSAPLHGNVCKFCDTEYN